MNNAVSGYLYINIIINILFNWVHIYFWLKCISWTSFLIKLYHYTVIWPMYKGPDLTKMKEQNPEFNQIKYRLKYKDSKLHHSYIIIITFVGLNILMFYKPRFQFKNLARNINNFGLITYEQVLHYNKLSIIYL